MRFLSVCWRQWRKEVAEKKDREEKRRIAKAFNDRYTYRHRWVESKDELEGAGAWGLPVRGGFAWMCPDCNKVHMAISVSSLTGLHFPRCCNWSEGHRLNAGIGMP